MYDTSLGDVYCFSPHERLTLALFLPLPRWENSRTSGKSRQGRAVVGVVSFFASHKYVASHCVSNRFQNDAVRRVTSDSSMVPVGLIYVTFRFS